MRHRLPHLIAALVVTLATLLLLAAPARAERPPNVVLLVGDDHAWPHAGFMGNPIVRTPNLDALAAGGTTFTHAQNPASVCQPSLRALLGAAHHDLWQSKTVALEAILGPLPRRSEVAHFRTVPRELARNGYRSWEGGKLWEGTFATAGFTHGLATAISPHIFVSVGDQFGRDGWSTGSALAPLQAFLDESAGEPFFLWVTPMLPHSPYDAPAELRAPYQQLGLPWHQASYYANVSWLDALIGQIVGELNARDLRDDTLIVYLSDNGIEIGNIGGTGHGKGTLYEMGSRTPLIFNWPGRIPAGVVRDDLVSTLDVPATMLDFAGADQITEGGARSLRAALETGAPAGRERIVSHMSSSDLANDGHWVRTPSWRYVESSDGREELYAIATDPLEEHDVAAEHPEVVAELRSAILDWQQQSRAGPPLLDASGRLVDHAGAPVAGETVRLLGRTTGGTKLALRVLTAANGAYLFDSVPQGQYALVGNHRSTSFAWGNRSGDIPFALPIGGLGSHLEVRTFGAKPLASPGTARISGTLHDAAGAPLPGALVTVRGGSPKVAVAVLSGPDGRYAAENLPAGSYRVVAKSRAPRGRAVARTSVAPDGRTSVDLALRS